jgi:hypothetical protein
LCKESANMLDGRYIVFAGELGDIR